MMFRRMILIFLMSSWSGDSIRVTDRLSLDSPTASSTNDQGLRSKRHSTDTQSTTSRSPHPHEQPKRGRTIQLTSTSPPSLNRPPLNRPNPQELPKSGRARQPLNAPISPQPATPPAWMTGKKFQGDIAGYEDQNDFDQFVERLNQWHNPDQERPNQELIADSALRDPRRLWASAKVPYRLESESQVLRQAVEAAIADFHSQTCVRFVERVLESSYLKIINSEEGCWSYIGQRVAGPQNLNLAPECWTKGTVLHELMHALGFWHEHQRTERDQFLQIHEENVIDRSCLQKHYQKSTFDQKTLIGDYDIRSIMHPPPTAMCSTNGRVTMTPKNHSLISAMGGREELSSEDVKKINSLYGCPPPATTTSTTATPPPVPTEPTIEARSTTTEPVPSRCPDETTFHSTDNNGNQFSVCAIVYDQKSCGGQIYVIEKGTTIPDLSQKKGGSRLNWTWDDTVESLEVNPNCTIILCRDNMLLAGCLSVMGGTGGKNLNDVGWLEGRVSSLICMCSDAVA